jgi:hypothetical protein
MNSEAKEGTLTPDNKAWFTNRFMYGVYSECRTKAPAKASVLGNAYKADDIQGNDAYHPDYYQQDKECSMMTDDDAKSAYGVSVTATYDSDKINHLCGGAMHYGQVCDTYCDLERNYLSEARNKRFGDINDGYKYRSERHGGSSAERAKRQNPLSYYCHSDGFIYPFILDHRDKPTEGEAIMVSQASSAGQETGLGMT